jgi:hypothetical protein
MAVRTWHRGAPLAQADARLGVEVPHIGKETLGAGGPKHRRAHDVLPFACPAGDRHVNA